jgi:halimadienyl-diphosphate synthase
MVLDWAGYPVQPDVFANYEHDTHFRCFQDETDPSLSAHIRLLLALKTRRDSSQYTSWVEKILKFVRDYQLNHAWTDKWHTSPFYLHSASIPALHAVDDVIASVHLQEVLGSQHSDGGWGYFGSSTLEETAYALQSLLYWHCHVSKIDKQVLTAGVAYLSLNMQKRQPSLWIGKCLYTPSNVVRAAVLSALHMYATL